METLNSQGIICLSFNNIEYWICEITYILNKDESYKYIFKPNYSVIDLLDDDSFQGIPGLNLDLRKKEYIRENITPTFISERVINKNREDFYQILQSMNMEYLNPIEYMIKNENRYSGDLFYVRPFQEKQQIYINNYVGKENTSAFIKNILNTIAKGHDLIIGKEKIDDSNRKLVHNILLKIYLRSLQAHKAKQKDGIAISKLNKVYKGRKPIEVEEVKFLDVLDKVSNKQLTSKQAAEKLNISIDKYYRLKKKLQK